MRPCAMKALWQNWCEHPPQFDCQASQWQVGLHVRTGADAYA